MTIKYVWKARAGHIGAASNWLDQTTGTSDGAPGLISKVNDDASVTDLATTTPDTFAGPRFAVQNAVSYSEQLITKSIIANVAFGWGEVGGFAVAQGNTAQSTTSRLTTDYNSIYSHMHPTSAVQLLAYPTLPPLDPTPAGTQSCIATAEANALGLLGGGTSVGGSVGLDSSLSWPWTSPSFLASDAAGILEHVISWNNYFSHDGITVGGPFETPVDMAARADAADWAPSVAADSFSDSNRSGGYLVGSSAGIVTEGAGAGTDVVRATAASFTQGTNAENLTYVGSGNLGGTCNNLANVIAGSVGDDSLNSGTGADALIGIDGNTCTVDHVGDSIVAALNAGIDSVNSSASYTLFDNVENLTLTSAGNINAVGNVLANVLTGNSGNSVLDGLAGADCMARDAGNDTCVVDNVGDAVTEAASTGTDLAQTTLSTYMPGLNGKNLTFIGTDNFTGIGNTLANALIDGGRNDTLNGGVGFDRLIGNAGNDTMTGGAGDRFFFFPAGIGQDIITDFHANPTGGQDLLDISGLGIAAAAFASSVTRAAASEGSTLVTIGGNSINLAGVTVNNINATGFRLAP